VSTLERYKKKGGFIQILTLIESSEPTKAAKFLSIIEQESQTWAHAIKEKALTLEKIKKLEKSVLYEAFDALPATVLANAMIKSPDLKEAIIPCLSAIKQKKTEVAMTENPDPRPGDIIACQLRMISALRAAITEGRVKQSSLPKELQISENIENELTQADWSKALASEKIESSAQSDVSPNSTKTTELQDRLQKLLEENHQLKKQVSDLQNKINQIKQIIS
jgi:hypothetical protein